MQHSLHCHRNLRAGRSEPSSFNGPDPITRSDGEGDVSPPSHPQDPFLDDWEDMCSENSADDDADDVDVHPHSEAPRLRRKVEDTLPPGIRAPASRWSESPNENYGTPPASTEIVPDAQLGDWLPSDGCRATELEQECEALKALVQKHTAAASRSSSNFKDMLQSRNSEIAALKRRVEKLLLLNETLRRSQESYDSRTDVHTSPTQSHSSQRFQTTRGLARSASHGNIFGNVRPRSTTHAGAVRVLDTSLDAPGPARRTTSYSGVPLRPPLKNFVTTVSAPGTTATDATSTTAHQHAQSHSGFQAQTLQQQDSGEVGCRQS